ncbi:DNA integrity scanning protein DisA nucleotide-binding domain protein [candidate division FCPU426 bacterium]|nr:DNA integrity scanning protein DisA nucleotide-binding domain protein [candidate division FCPU426 bacterium]
MQIWLWAREIGVAGFFDLTFMAILIYIFLIWFKKTPAASVLMGIIIVAGIYLLTRQFNLIMTATVFEKFFAVILIALIIIFQEELRHVFERIAVFSLSRSPLSKPLDFRSFQPEIQAMVRSLSELAREKIGALLVFQGWDLLERHLEGGIALDGQVSEPLISSIFDPHSIGHDGAAVIKDNRIRSFMAHLPLSKNTSQLGNKGTRHAAALGLSELTDALCVVVSEERGTISVARHGLLTEMKELPALINTLESFFQEIQPRKPGHFWLEMLRSNYREKALAVVLALGLWFVLVQGAQTHSQTYRLPVQFLSLPLAWNVSACKPAYVHLTLRGPRRAFFFLSTGQLHLQLKPRLVEKQQRLHISLSNLHFPKELAFVDVSPDAVSVTLQKKKESPATKPRAPTR